MAEGRKIAILGSASSSLSQAPFGDSSWEIWALGQETRRVSRFFEIHPDKMVKPWIRKQYTDRNIPVYSLSKINGVDTLQIPVQEISDRLNDGALYFTSSVAYMVALALLEHENGRTIDTIAIYGIDMLTASEYAAQRPCLEYWLGMLKPMGIKKVIPTCSALLKANHVYGLQPQPENNSPFTPDYYRKRIAQYRKNLADMEKNCYVVTGAIQEAELMLDYILHFERGGHVPGSEA